VAVKKTSKYNL